MIRAMARKENDYLFHGSAGAWVSPAGLTARNNTPLVTGELLKPVSLTSSDS